MCTHRHLLRQIGLIVLFLSLFVARPERATGQDWVGGDGLWHDSANWSPSSVPGFGDLVFIGRFESTVKDLSIRLDQPVFSEDLRIGNGNRLVNRVSPADEAFPINLWADLEIAGENGLNPGPTQPAGVIVHPTAAPVDLTTARLVLSDGSEFGLREGAVANIGVSMTIGSTARFTGQGVINFLGDAFGASNNGIIDAQGVLTFNQLGESRFDLDGFEESGKLFVGSSSGGSEAEEVFDHFTVNGVGLTDPFSGKLTLANDRHLTMNLAEGWTLDAESSVSVGVDTATTLPATINGSHVTLEGETTLIDFLGESGRAAARFNADTTINPSASFSLGVDALLRFAGETTVEGGQFTLKKNASFLQFTGPTTLRGGTFTTFSESTAEGSVLLAGDTEWDGDVTIDGVARQAAFAVVAGPTVINAQRFDMDGLEELSGFDADWQIDSSLTVNARSIDVGDDENVFNRTITVGGGSFSRLTLNLAEPAGQWTMAGTLNLTNNLPFGATRLGGSKVWLQGETNVAGSDIRVDADSTFVGGSSTGFADPDSSLTMRQQSRVEAGAQFVGVGMLQNAATGQMILDDGANTSDVGVRNAGLLDIAEAAGIAAVDRFENSATGTLVIDLRGYLLGEEFDHLQVNGETLLDGTLAVELLTVGLVGDGLFAPQLGDEFVILTSLDGVSGEFANVLPTFGDGNVYGWEVLYHPHDVTIRLASVGPVVPEPTSLALLAVAAIGAVCRRR